MIGQMHCSCGKELFPFSAARKHCTSPQHVPLDGNGRQVKVPSRRSEILKVGGVIAGLVVIGLFVAVGPPRQMSPEAIAAREARSASSTRETQRLTAIVACRMAVTDRLKAPSTADFAGGEDVRDNGGGVAIVIGAVDAQNSFGAKLRTRWICHVDVNDPRNGRVQSVVVEQ